MGDSVRVTALGSPCSGRWCEERVGEIEEIEARLGRRICGAGALGDDPCTLEPAAANGRCSYHGGVAGIGGQRGNRNAVKHGLYSRRVRVEEEAEYGRVLRGLLVELGVDPDAEEDLDRPRVPNGFRFARRLAVLAAESVALTKVMVSRASAVVLAQGVDDGAVDSGVDGAAQRELRTPDGGACGDVGAAWYALARINREHRQWLKFLGVCGREVFAGLGRVHYGFSRSVQDELDRGERYARVRVSEPEGSEWARGREKPGAAAARARFLEEIRGCVIEGLAPG